MTNEYFARPRHDFFDGPTTRWVILRNGFALGRLTQNGNCFKFVATHAGNEELEAWVGQLLVNARSLRAALAAIRHAGDAQMERDMAEARHEMACENAALRAAEYNPEHYDEMVREDMMGLS